MVDTTVISIINLRLRITQRVIKLEIINCIATDSPTLMYATMPYITWPKRLAIEQPKSLRVERKPTQLFLFWTTKRTVTKRPSPDG
jgi:hypothetical protein